MKGPASGHADASVAAGMCPLFPGESDFDQLGRVVEILGSIRLPDWPEAEHMPDFRKVPPGAMTSSHTAAVHHAPAEAQKLQSALHHAHRRPKGCGYWCCGPVCISHAPCQGHTPILTSTLCTVQLCFMETPATDLKELYPDASAQEVDLLTHLIQWNPGLSHIPSTMAAIFMV